MELTPEERAAITRWSPGNTRVNRFLAWLVMRLSQWVMQRRNRMSIDGLERLRALHDRDERGLLTFSNHVSRLDDPLLISNCGLDELPYDRMRWVSADALTLFGTRTSAFIFSAGKCVPTVRGGGLEQPALIFLRDRLRDGAWIHIFPEGGANRDPRARLRHPLKAGIGRLIDETHPLVLPFYHYGMHRVAPHRQLPGRGQHVHVLFGKAVDCDRTFVERLAGSADDRRTRWDRISEWAHGVLQELEERLVTDTMEPS